MIIPGHRALYYTVRIRERLNMVQQTTQFSHISLLIRSDLEVRVNMYIIQARDIQNSRFIILSADFSLLAA